MSDLAKIEPRNDAPAIVSDPLVSLIERVLLNPDLPMERVSAMLDIRERQLAKEAEQAFNAAFAAAMAEMPDVPRSGENKHLKRRYSTLDDLIRTARPVLARHGLSLNWQTGEEGGRIKVRAIVRHAAGHSITTERSGVGDKSSSMNLLQGEGSTETYLKRYTGFAILGLSSGDEQDDDGRGATPKNEAMDAEDFAILRERIDAQGDDAGKVEDFILNRFRVEALHDLDRAQMKTALSMIRKREQAKRDAA